MKTSEKRRVFHSLLYKLGALKNKPDILAQYGAASTTQLNDRQLDELIDRLRHSITKRYEASDELRRWRSNALTLINRCGIYATNNDWTAVNSFMLNPRIAGKLLYELSIPELKQLCKKLRAIAEKREQNKMKDLLKISVN